MVPSIFSLKTREIGVCTFGLALDVHALLGHSVQEPAIVQLSLHSRVVLVSLDLSAPLHPMFFFCEIHVCNNDYIRLGVVVITMVERQVVYIVCNKWAHE
ncbi:unnamed protein product [Ixodes pacificus]